MNFPSIIAKTPEDLRASLELRKEIFIQEQGIPESLEVDGKDEGCIIAVVKNSAMEVVATGRLYITSDSRAEISRIGVKKEFRNNGLALKVINTLHNQARKNGIKTVHINPHAHLEMFYSNLGYIKKPGQYKVGDHDLISMENTLQ